MVVSAAAEGGWPILELLLTLASVGTFLHTGLKLPYFTFFGASRGLETKPIPRNMLVAMGLAASLCLGLGLFPSWLYARLPFVAGYEPYTLDHVISALQLLLGTAVAFALLLGKLGGQATMSLDTDWIYRRPLHRAMAGTVTFCRGAGHRLQGLGVAVVAASAPLARNPTGALGRLFPTPSDDVAAPGYDLDIRRLPIGATILWVVAALGLTALFIGPW